MCSSLNHKGMTTKINSKTILRTLIFFIILSSGVYFINNLFSIDFVIKYKMVAKHNQNSESHLRLSYSKFNEQNIKDEVVYQKMNPKESIWWSTEIHGKYTVLKDYIKSNERPDYNRSVTLTTQGTYGHLYHIEMLCRRWDGHISVAVYSPGHDFQTSIKFIYYLRQCKDICVKRKTSWHFVYDTIYGPQSNILFPYSYVNDMNMNCDNSFEDMLKEYGVSFREIYSLLYPINVVRNVARLNAKTEYVFASDIEFYPSLGFVPAFLNFIDREKSGLVPMISRNTPHVYVLPEFEIEEGIDPPMTKPELKQLLKSGKAIIFHKLVCGKCHEIPGNDEWIELDSSNNSLGIFSISKRYRKNWEPFYVGTNAEPLFDERLTWEGKQDKMQQVYELCLMSYDFAVFDNAFIVHAPGIKKPQFYDKDHNMRMPYIKQNVRFMEIINIELKIKYGIKNTVKC